MNGSQLKLCRPTVAVFSWLIAGTWAGVLACSSSSHGAVAGTHSNTDAGNQPDAGDLGDVGAYGACTSKLPVDSAPDLTGSWALRTVASRYVPATGLTAAFYTRTVSVLLVNQTQTGAQISMNAEYCDQTASTDATALAYVIIPDSYVKSIKPFVRLGSYAPGSDGVNVLILPSFVEVQGATLADPVNDALPTDPSDPAVTDQDQDGNPGITIKLGGIVSGDLYVVQRQTSELTGIAVSSDRIEGHYGFTSEQNVLASNPSSLKVLAAQTAITDSNLCASTFAMVRVQAASTCADLVANSTLFD